MSTVKVLILTRLCLGGDRIGEAGEVVEVDALTAHAIIAPGRADAVHPERAKAAIEAAVIAANAAALRIEKQGQPRAAPPLSWVAGGRR